MRYLSFTIRHYRAIRGPIVIDVGNRSLIPIIGVNESGKTTILQAIHSFDLANDNSNDGLHLKDTNNLFSLGKATPATVAARIGLSKKELLESLQELEKQSTYRSAASALRGKRRLPAELTITRNLKTTNYSIDGLGSLDAKFADALARDLIRYLPYTLYFDEFRDSFADKVEIRKPLAGDLTDWLAIMEELFDKADTKASVLDLPTMDPLLRKTTIAKAERTLNDTLTREWQNFRLDETDALKIKLDFVQENTQVGVQSFLKLEVVEKAGDGNDYYFYIRNRSKGFYWSFNFVMKLEFNPTTVGSAEGTIYLLDEPGSYLHASAQSKLCAKLQYLSQSNVVFYCTHSHYLLNPQHIPLKTIQIADRDVDGSVTLAPIFMHPGTVHPTRSAYEPVLAALQTRPFLLDLTSRTVVIVEGIYDHYSFEMFKGDREVGFLPSTNADGVKYYVSLMLAWGAEFKALWDNDDAGRAGLKSAKQAFGDEMADNRFFLLPGSGTKRTLEHLYDEDDLNAVRQALGLNTNVSFEKLVLALHYAENRAAIIAGLSGTTRANFDEVFVSIGL